MEYVDIVDSDDRVIGKELKDVCHAQGFLHRGAGLFIFSDATYQHLLLQKRSANVRNGGKWCHPGGHVISGETYEMAAQREFYEELFRVARASSHTPYVFERLFTLLKEEPEDRELITLYRVIAPGPFVPDPLEVTQVQFFDVQKIINDVRVHPEQYTVAFHHLFEKYCEEFLYATHR